MPGEWTFVREDATYSYNMMKHSTTGNTPFTLMHGLPIRQVMNGEVFEAVLYHHLLDETDDIEELFQLESNTVNEIDTSNFDDLDHAMNEDSAIDNSLMLETQESNMMIREDARRSTNTAVERMVKRSIWKNDYMEFKIGNRVQIRPDIDANENQEPDQYSSISILMYTLLRRFCSLIR
ncbi:hypothetical protein COBT_002532 [Conglomerata obtusa]